MEVRYGFGLLVGRATDIIGIACGVCHFWADPMPDALLTALFNMGPVGVLAGVLLLLHTNSIKAFRAELTAERATCETRHDKIMDKLDDIKDLVS